MANELVDALNPLLRQSVRIVDKDGKVLDGAVGEFKYSAGNVVLVLKGLGAPADAPKFAFQCIGSTTDGKNNVQVIYGTVRDVVNAVDWVPTDMYPGDSPPFIVSDVGDGFGGIYLNITTDLDSDTGIATITSVTIDAEGLDETDTQTSLSLGGFYTDEHGNFQVSPGASGNQGYLYCGGHFLWLI